MVSKIVPTLSNRDAFGQSDRSSNVNVDLAPVEDVFQLGFDQVRVVAPDIGCLGFLLKREGNGFEIVFARSPAGQYKDPLTENGTFFGGDLFNRFLTELTADITILTSENQENENASEIAAGLDSIDMKRWMMGPLFAQHQPVGALLVYQEETKPFNPTQRTLFSLVLRQVGMALFGAQAIGLEEQKRSQAETLANLTDQLLNVSTLPELFDISIATFIKLFGEIDYCSLAVLDEKVDPYLVEIGSWSADSLDVENIRDRIFASSTLLSVVEEGETYVWQRNDSDPSESFDEELDQAAGVDTLLIFPLKSSPHEPVNGFIAVGKRVKKNRSDSKNNLAKRAEAGMLVTSCLAGAIKTILLQEEQQTQLKLSQTLQKIGAILTVDLYQNDFFNELFDLLAQVVQYDAVSVQLYDEYHQTLTLVKSRGFENIGPVHVFVDNLGDLSLSKFSGSEKLVLIEDTALSRKWISPDDKGVEVSKVRSYIGAKLEVRGRFWGVLNVDGFKPNQFNSRMAETVMAFANQAAVALEGNSLFKTINRRVTELSMINRVMSVIATLDNIDDVIRETTKALSDSIYGFNFGLIMVDQANQQFVVNPHYHYSNSREPKQTIPIDEGIVGIAYRERRTVVRADVEEEPLYFQSEKNTKSEIAVPILLDDQVVGLINAESPYYNAFKEDDQSFIETLAGQLSIAFQRIELFEEVERYNSQLTEMVANKTSELNAEKERLQAILENTDEGVIFSDGKGEIEFINYGTTRQSGFEGADVLGRSLDIFFSQQTSPVVKREIKTAIENGDSWRGEMLLRRKNETVYEGQLVLTPLSDDHGRTVSYVMVINDITRFKEVERLKSNFVSNVSHELRTPLTNIRTYVTLLKKGREDRRERYYEVLDQELDRLTTLIQDLLDVGKVDSYPVREMFQLFDIIPLLNQIIVTIQAMDVTNTNFEIQLPSSLPQVWGDPSQLQLAFSNIIKNSLAYSPAGSEVKIVGGQRGDNIFISISDQGSGISKEELPHLFDRFFRGSAALTTRNAGTGLGLSITKEVVSLHRGKIKVDSQPNQGTTVTVWLPAIEKTKD